MPSVKTSHILAQIGIELDSKSMKKVRKGFHEIDKYYASLIKDMKAHDKRREKEQKAHLKRTFDEYKKSLNRIEKHTKAIKNINLLNMAKGGFNSIGKVFDFLDKAEKRSKDLVDATRSLDDFAYSMRLSAESVQHLEEAGKDFHLSASDTRSFISTLKNLSDDLKFGEANESTGALQILGVQRGDKTHDILNKIIPTLKGMDEMTRQSYLRDLGISSESLQGFSDMIAHTTWSTLKKNSTTRIVANKDVKASTASARAIEQARADADKAYLETSLEKYESMAINKIKRENALDLIILEIAQKVDEVMDDILKNILPHVPEMIQKAKEIFFWVKDKALGVWKMVSGVFEGIKNTIDTISQTIQDLVAAIKRLLWIKETPPPVMVPKYDKPFLFSPSMRAFSEKIGLELPYEL